MRGKLKDHLEWGRTADPRRTANAYRIWSSFRKARRTGVPEIKGLPLTISFEPTTACNLRCPECPSGLRSFTRPTGNLKADLFEQVIDELAPDLWGLTFYFQGEPYINPAFLDMAAYARRVVRFVDGMVESDVTQPEPA